METIEFDYGSAEDCQLNGYYGAIDRENNRRLFPFTSPPPLTELNGYVAKRVDTGIYVVVPGVE